MKLMVISAAVVTMSMSAVMPAAAQRDPACIEKCNRANPRPPGFSGMREHGTAVRTCIQGCPKASGKK
jgi:hypothetical protein